jgi:propionyl-CoA carboxylase alpha chain
MLAKLIAWAPARPAAAAMLASALDRARIHGPATNRHLLARVLRDPVFTGGGADTSLLDGYDLAGLVPGEQACRLSAVAAALAGAAENRAAARAAAGLPSGWRNVVSQPQRTAFNGPRGRVEVGYLWRRDGIVVVPEDSAADPEAAHPAGTAGGDPVAASAAGRGGLLVAGAEPGHAVLEVAGVRYRFDVARAGDTVWVDSAFGSVALTRLPRLAAPGDIPATGSLVAPMPGNVARVEADRGDRVRAGQPVVVLEAMKMEHQIVAPTAGRLAEVRVAAGDQVQAGDVLAVVQAEGQT